jgi:hypothetical protein
MRTALATFQSDIGRINKVVDWLITPPAAAPDMLPATVAIRCGSVVLLSGYLESFISNCMEEFITRLNSLGKPLDRLPNKLKLTHFDNGARVLQYQLKRDRRAGDTSVCEDISARLASVASNTGYQLLWEAFADTAANPGPSVIGGVLSGVGIEDPWTQITSNLPAGIGNLQLFLTSFIEMRNECAHSGLSAAPPTPNDLLDYGRNLSELATAMVTLLEAKLAEFAAL